MRLITGCNSFLGKKLVKRLLDMGEPVRGLDMWMVKDFPEKAEFTQGNTLDYELLKSACEGVDVLYHLLSVDDSSHYGRRFMKKINVGGAENVIRAARESRVKKIIFLSSAEVYGQPEVMPIREDDLKKPITPYGRDMLRAEKVCWNSIEKDEMDITIFRPTIMAGAGIDDSMILIMLYMALGMEDANRLYIAGDGNSRFQLVHYGDVVDAMLAAVQTPASRGKIYNLGSDNVPTQMDQVVKVREKAELDCQIKHITPFFAKILSFILRPLNINYLKKEHLMFILSNFLLDCDSAKKDLSWKPKMDNIEIFVDTIQWYKKEKL